MEKVSKKKAKKGLGKGVLFSLLLLLAALGGAGAYFFSRPVLPEPTLLPDIILLDAARDEITALAISSPDGINYPLIRGTDGNFTLLGQEDTPLRSDVVEEMLKALSHLEAEDAILNTDNEIADLSHFGLSPAKAQITITYADGEQKALYIGSEAPTEEPQYYCMLSGDSTVYMVLAAFCEPFFQDAAYLRAFEQPELDASLLNRIDLSGDTTLGLHYTSSGWLLDIPFSYPLDTGKTNSLLSSIEFMAFEACLGRKEDLNLADYGLADPALTIALTQAPTLITGENSTGETVTVEVPSKIYTLLIGSETGQSGVYVLWDHQVFRASNFLLGFWKELTLDFLLLRNPVNFLVNDLTHISFSHASGSRSYEVELVESITENNEIATDEYGQVLYDVQALRTESGKKVDTQSFLTWYTSLSALSPAGSLPEGYALQGEPIASLLIKSQSISREISFYPYDALHSAMAVDGESLYYIETAKLDMLLQSAP
ncbi:MAG: DUF4340 domain-containing protein [Clostridiales bacterium]|nr:DUF4340 domain-containing protein [Clostridiales bacterium]